MSLLAQHEGDALPLRRATIPVQPGSGLGTRPLFVRPRCGWLPRYARVLVALDAAVLGLAAVVAVVASGGPAPASTALASGVVVGLWWASLALNRTYEKRYLAEGPEEFRRVANASLRVGCHRHLAAYALQLPLPRTFVAHLLLLGAAGLLLGRFAARRVVVAGRRQGRFCRTVLIAGSSDEVRELAQHLHRNPTTGLRVVGVCQPDVHTRRVPLGPGVTVPVVGSLATVPGAASMTGADVVAVTPGPAVTSERCDGCRTTSRAAASS
jgi:FlaA1/EpsC-like NDP-sugar epimerase